MTDTAEELETERHWTDHVAKYPLRARQDAAAARNTQIRVRAYREQMISEGRKLKTQVMKLHKVHGMNPNLIGKVLGVHRTRVLEILGKK